MGGLDVAQGDAAMAISILYYASPLRLTGRAWLHSFDRF